MRSDLYLRVVLTVIAAALVYLCVVFTPMPTVSAQRIVGGRTPGEYTGPAEVVIVDWRLPDGATLPVHVMRGDVRVANEVSVKGNVQVVQAADNPLRTLLIGHEEGASLAGPGRFVGMNQATGRGLPVVSLARP